MLEKFDRGASKDVYKIVIGDELCIYAYESETKQQSTEPNPTKVVCEKITLKQMVTCFICKTGHMATVPLEHRRTVNSEWYTTVCLAKVFGKNSKNEQENMNHCSP